jgi:hypothetical protein
MRNLEVECNSYTRHRHCRMRPATTRCFSLKKIPPQFLDAPRTLHSFLDAPRPLWKTVQSSGRVESRGVFLGGLAIIQKKDLAKFGYSS